MVIQGAGTIEYLELVVEVIGHLAWPTAIVIIFSIFRNEISGFLARVKNAKYKGVELNLEKELEELKTDAGKAGVKISYDTPQRIEKSQINQYVEPEWLFVQSWQEIENLVLDHYSKVSGLKDTRVTMAKALTYLHKNGIIDDEMVMLLNKFRSTRNHIIHSHSSNLSKGEAIEWLGIANSVKMRLEQKLA